MTTPHDEEAAVRRMIGLMALILVIAACGDDSGGNPLGLSTTSTSTTAAAPTTTATTAAPATTAAAPDTTAAPGGDADLPPGTPYTEFSLVGNAAIEVRVPVEWNDFYDGPYVINGEEVGVAFAASPNHDGLISAFDTPGVFIGMSTDPSVTSELIFSVKDFSNTCTYGGRDVYDDGEYRGHFDAWLDCDGSPSDFTVIVAEPYAGGAIALVEITLVTDADYEALQNVLASWRIDL